MKWKAFLALKWNVSKIAGIWSHEGTWHPPFQSTRTPRRWSNTTWRGKRQRYSHHFSNNYVFRPSMPLANMLNDVNSRSNSQALFATEWTSSCKLHTTGLLKRQKGWLLHVEVPQTFHTQTTVPKVRLKASQRSDLFSLAPVPSSHSPQSYPMLGGSKWLRHADQKNI